MVTQKLLPVKCNRTFSRASDRLRECHPKCFVEFDFMSCHPECFVKLDFMSCHPECSVKLKFFTLGPDTAA